MPTHVASQPAAWASACLAFSAVLFCWDKMRSHQMLQPAAIQRGEEPGCRFVVQMAVGTGDPPPQRHRVIAGLEHFPIVIALEYQRVYAAQHAFDVCSRMTRIGQQTELQRAVRKYELHGLPRIVRYRERLDPDTAHIERTVTVDDLDVRELPHSSLDTGQRAVSQENRNIVASRKAEHAADMIAVFVGHDHGGDVCRTQVQTGQSSHRFA